MFLTAGKRMAKAAYAAMDAATDAGVPVFVSPITAWEVGMQARKGRFDSPLSPQEWLRRLLGSPGIEYCDLSADTLLAASYLPGTLRTEDPADRIIAATAREHGFAVVTRDRALLEYGAGGHLAVVEC